MYDSWNKPVDHALSSAQSQAPVSKNGTQSLPMATCNDICKKQWHVHHKMNPMKKKINNVTKFAMYARYQ